MKTARGTIGLVLLAASFLLPPVIARAQEVPLEMVIRAALDHDTKITRADLRMKQAQARLQQAEGVFDWRASARAGWTRLYFPRVETLNGSRVLTDKLDSSSTAEVTTGFSRQFRSGLTVQPGITFYPGTNTSQAQTFGLTRPRPTINLSVPLLHGFDRDNPAAASERAAQSEVIATSFERLAAQQQAVLDGVQSYWRCLAAQEEAKILGDERDASQANIVSLQRLVRAGQAAGETLDRAQARQAQKDNQLAKIREAEGSCRADLAVLLNRDSNMPLPTITAAFPGMELVSAAGLSEQALTETALKNRSDLYAMQQYVAAASERVAGAKTGLDPKLDLVINPDSVFVVVSKNLGANAEEGAVAGAEAAAGEARLNVSELTNQIRHDVSRGLAALRNSLSTLAALKQSDGQLARLVDDARRAEQSGTMDAAQLRTLEEERANLRVQLAEAELDMALNLAALRLVTGTISTNGAVASSQNALLFRSLQFQ